MREFAKSFYASKAWKDLRTYIFFKRDHQMCVRCGKPGKIVHHKEHLTPENISDPFVSLNADNLETLCSECHAIEHEGSPATDKSLMFDDEGNLVERSGLLQW